MIRHTHMARTWPTRIASYSNLTRYAHTLLGRTALEDGERRGLHNHTLTMFRTERERKAGAVNLPL
jgi:hypothetical protein